MRNKLYSDLVLSWRMLGVLRLINYIMDDKQKQLISNRTDSKNRTQSTILEETIYLRLILEFKRECIYWYAIKIYESIKMQNSSRFFSK